MSDFDPNEELVLSASDVDPDSTEFNFCLNNKWVMKLRDDGGVYKIEFNFEEHPELTSTGMAKAVVDVLHKSSMLDGFINRKAEEKAKEK